LSCFGISAISAISFASTLPPSPYSGFSTALHSCGFHLPLETDLQGVSIGWVKVMDEPHDEVVEQCRIKIAMYFKIAIK
jgi:hypothetical protein